MNLEIFSHSKYKNNLLDGDDVILHLPDQVYAVFDGATDVHNTMLNGVSVGRVAASTIASEICNLVCSGFMNKETPLKLLLEKFRASLEIKFSGSKIKSMPSTTAAMVFEYTDCYRLIVIGDSSVRINSSTIYSKKKTIDAVSTFARVWVFKYLTGKLGLSVDETEAIVRKISFLGLDLAVEEAILTQENANEVIEATAKETVLDVTEVSKFLRVGIQKQHLYANNSDNVLGYGCLNSTEFITNEAIDICVPKKGVKMIEIYSDGYLTEPDCPANVDSWESVFNFIENRDFQKINKYPSIKGSNSDQFSDDRSIIMLFE